MSFNFPDNRFNRYLLFSVYVILNTIMLFHHEMWRDEIQAFSVVRESATITELIHNTQYEGHPGLWFFILFIAKQINGSFFFAQIVHLIIISAGIFIFLMHAPLKLLFKALIVFGYFFMYEYSVIARNYAFGILLLFLICSLLGRNKIVYASVALVFLVNANVYAWFLGTAMLMIIILAFYKTHIRETITAAIVGLSGIIGSALYTFPPADSGWATGYYFSKAIFIESFSTIAKTFLPLPETGMYFWNSSIFESRDSYTLAVITLLLSAVILIYCFYYLRSSFLAQLFFGSSVVIIIIFTAVKYFGAFRHHGHLFVAFIVAMWLSEIFKSNGNTFLSFNKIKIPGRFANKNIINGVMVLLLSVHVITSAIAYYYDYRYSFSKASEVAEYISGSEMTNNKIIGYTDAPASTIAGLLNKKIYYPESGSESTYLTWNNKRNANAITDDSLLSYLSNANMDSLAPLLVTNFPIISDSLLKAKHVHLVKSFFPAIENSEEFYLYAKD